ncbi:MAG: glycosyltransferase [Pseudomonadota bacterium]
MRNDDHRILFYSHDTFGLGHLRRCLTIAHDLVGRGKALSALILTGSGIIGRFDFRARVDFVRIPGVIKLRNGTYTPLKLHIDIEDTLSMRESIIRHTADIFNPDLFLVDKEPLGLRGEVQSTLEMLKARGTPMILGLRDIMDDPDLLEPEWERKQVGPALQDFYDQIWVYGVQKICDPLEGIGIADHVRKKMRYSGYLRRQLPAGPALGYRPRKIGARYILVTPGGGGDGEEMIDWVMQAYETRTPGLPPALMVLGPFMETNIRNNMICRANELSNVEIITFDSHMEELVHDAIGVVAMGGYNTFCEILSFDKPAICVPRTVPRREQLIRAQRAHELELLRLMRMEERDITKMVEALIALPDQPPPSFGQVGNLLGGLDNVARWTDEIIEG